MTPFGLKLRQLRKAKKIQQSRLAADLGLSAAYLSALEHGNRGRPSRELVHEICGYFGLIWEEADELQRLADLSDPKVVIDTAGLHPAATELANRLKSQIANLSEDQLEGLISLLK